MTSRGWAFVVVLAAVTLVHLAVDAASGLALRVAAVSAAVALSAWRARVAPRRRALWTAVAGACALEPSVNLTQAADWSAELSAVLMVGGYFAVGYVLWILGRELVALTPRLVVLDAAVLGAGLAMVAWTLTMAPTLSAQAGLQVQSWRDVVLAATFLVIGLVLAVTLIAALGAGACTPATGLLIAGIGAVLLSDVLWFAQSAVGVYRFGPADLGFTLGPLFVAAATLSPGSDRPALPDAPPHAVATFTGRWAALRPLWWVVGVLAPLLLLARATADGDASLAVLSALGVAVTVGVLVRMGELVRLARRQAAELADLARLDPLTGTLNRRAWLADVERLVRRTATAGEPCALAVLDLDHFKAFNDAHGHLAGDDALRASTGAWQAVLRPQDLLARWGGEEFVVCLPGCDEPGLRGIADRLLTAMPPTLTASVGGAVIGPDESPAEALQRADAALYAAKHGGRARFVLADDGGPRVCAGPASYWSS